MSDDLIRRSDAIKAIRERLDSPHMQNVLQQGACLSILRAIENAPTIEPKAKVVAQITFNEEKLREIVHEAVERFKEEYEIVDRPQEWIPCSERLPEKQTTVLYSLEGCVSVAFMTDRNYTGETVEWHWEDLETGITIYPEAWMPLPKPWKGADDGNK